MTTDFIVAEVRANREAVFAERGYDRDLFDAHIRKLNGWVFAAQPTARHKPVGYPSTPSGSSVIREDHRVATHC